MLSIGSSISLHSQLTHWKLIEEIAQGLVSDRLLIHGSLERWTLLPFGPNDFLAFMQTHCQLRKLQQHHERWAYNHLYLKVLHWMVQHDFVLPEQHRSSKNKRSTYASSQLLLLLHNSAAAAGVVILPPASQHADDDTIALYLSHCAKPEFTRVRIDECPQVDTTAALRVQKTAQQLTLTLPVVSGGVNAKQPPMCKTPAAAWSPQTSNLLSALWLRFGKRGGARRAAKILIDHPECKVLRSVALMYVLIV